MRHHCVSSQLAPKHPFIRKWRAFGHGATSETGSILHFFQKHFITEDAHQALFIKFYEGLNGKHCRDARVKIIFFSLQKPFSSGADKLSPIYSYSGFNFFFFTKCSLPPRYVNVCIWKKSSQNEDLHSDYGNKPSTF